MTEPKELAGGIKKHLERIEEYMRRNKIVPIVPVYKNGELQIEQPYKTINLRYLT